MLALCVAGATPLAALEDLSVPGSCSVVVAEHDAVSDVQLVRSLAPSHCRLHVYSKSASCKELRALNNTRCEELANWGREQHTFLRHVVRNYHEGLTDHLFFVPTPLDKHARLEALQQSFREAAHKSFHCLSRVPDYALDERMLPHMHANMGESLASTSQCSLLWINSWVMVNAGQKVSKFTIQANHSLSWADSMELSQVERTRDGYDFAKVDVHEDNIIDLIDDDDASRHKAFTKPSDCRCFGIFSPPPGKGGKLKTDDIVAADVQPMGPWAMTYLGEETVRSFCRAKVCSGGSFHTTRENIQARNFTVYDQIFSSLPRMGADTIDAGAENTFYLEKLLHVLYGWPSVPTTPTCLDEELSCVARQTVRTDSVLSEPCQEKMLRPAKLPAGTGALTPFAFANRLCGRDGAAENADDNAADRAQ